jgi:hypothetical protein
MIITVPGPSAGLASSAVPVPYTGDGYPVMLTNLSLVNTIYLYEDTSVDPADLNRSSQLPPLGTMVVDGTLNEYAICIAGQTANLQAVPHGESWGPSPAQIAEQILASGIPIVNNDDNVLVSVGSVLPGGGGSITFPSTGFYDVTGLSWGLALNSRNLSVSPGPTVVNVQFWDPSGSYLVGHKTITFWPGTSSGTSTVIAGGPTRGSMCRVVINDFSAVSSPSTVDVLFFQSSRTVKSDFAEASVFTSCASGVTLPGCDPPGGIIASSSPSLATGASAVRQLPVWMGLVQLAVQSTSGAADALVNLTVNADEAGIPNFNFWNGKTDANGNLSAQISMPASQCTVTLTNKNAATQTISLMMTSADSTVT